MPTQPEIRILKTATELFEAAAAEFAAQASAAVRAKGRFTVALSGGSTPRTLYSLLATKPGIPWDKICIFWGDERHVPPDHPESNYRMVNEALLVQGPGASGKCFSHSCRGKRCGRGGPAIRAGPRGFLSFLSRRVSAVRSDFPGRRTRRTHRFPLSRHIALNETKRLVVANWVPKFNTDRITFTFPVLNAAACVMFLPAEPTKPQSSTKYWRTGARICRRKRLPSQRQTNLDGG